MPCLLACEARIICSRPRQTLDPPEIPTDDAVRGAKSCWKPEPRSPSALITHALLARLHARTICSRPRQTLEPPESPTDDACIKILLQPEPLRALRRVPRQARSYTADSTKTHCREMHICSTLDLQTLDSCRQRSPGRQELRDARFATDTNNLERQEKQGV